MAANGYSTGITDLTQDVTAVCPVPENGVRVKNLGTARAYFGGPDVDSSGNTGYPLEPGEADTFPGAKAKETPVVPAPEGDMDPPVLYGRIEPGGQDGKVSWISVTMT